MHEVSLVRALLAQACQIVDDEASASHERGRSRMLQISAVCGPLAGVEPCLVHSAFETLKPEFGLTDICLDLIEEELQAKCRSCNSLFTVRDFVFRCPTCHSSSVQVISGDQFRLLSIEIDEN